eukprot:7320473-Prymnesium_polylepis.3
MVGVREGRHLPFVRLADERGALRHDTTKQPGRRRARSCRHARSRPTRQHARARDPLAGTPACATTHSPAPGRAPQSAPATRGGARAAPSSP